MSSLTPRFLGEFAVTINNTFIQGNRYKLTTLFKFTGKMKDFSFIFIEFETIMNRPISWVISRSSVTVESKSLFFYWFAFFESEIRYLAEFFRGHFSKWPSSTPILTISQPTEDTEVCFWWLYPGFRGRGIQWNNDFHIKMQQSAHGGHFVFQMVTNPTNSWYRPISTQNVHIITCLGLYQSFLGRIIDCNNYLSAISYIWNMAFMFFKMAAIPTNFHHISAYSGHKIVILIAIPRFWGSGNPVEQSFKHKNALKRTWWPFSFSKWPPIQLILDYKPISVQHVQELRLDGYTRL